MVNRSTAETATVEIEAAGIPLKSVQSAEFVTGPSPDAGNTFDSPDTIRDQKFDGIELNDGKATLTLPPLSIAAISFNTTSGQ